MKQWVYTIISITLFSIYIFSQCFLDTLAEDHSVPERKRYFTCIEIQKGDTLWSIAQVYSRGGDLSMEEYLDELRSMNNLKEEIIHTGRYLTIMYFE